MDTKKATLKAATEEQLRDMLAELHKVEETSKGLARANAARAIKRVSDELALRDAAQAEADADQAAFAAEVTVGVNAAITALQTAGQAAPTTPPAEEDDEYQDVTPRLGLHFPLPEEDLAEILVCDVILKAEKKTLGERSKTGWAKTYQVEPGMYVVYGGGHVMEQKKPEGAAKVLWLVSAVEWFEDSAILKPAAWVKTWNDALTFAGGAPQEA